jgi:hypothetical protein
LDKTVAASDRVVDVLPAARGVVVFESLQKLARQLGEKGTSFSKPKRAAATFREFAAKELRQLPKLPAVLTVLIRIIWTNPDNAPCRLYFYERFEAIQSEP